MAVASASCGRPGASPARSQTSTVVELTPPPDAVLRGVTGSDRWAAIAWSTRSGSQIELRHRHSTAWRVDLPGTPGPIALAPTFVAAARSAKGEAGAVVVGLDVHTGAVMWQRVVDATQWALITSLAVIGKDVVIAGTFSGTLRVGRAVVSSGGQADGFVGRLSSHGDVAWLRRLGGPGADSISAVAVRDNMIAIAGSVTTGAEFAGHPVEPRDAKSPYGDGFVAALRSTGDYMWSHTFGGPGDDSAIGVAIDAAHHIAVATTIVDTTRIGTRAVSPRGLSAGLVVFASPQGELGSIALVDGTGSVRLRSMAAAGAGIVVGGVFGGTLAAGESSIQLRTPSSGVLRTPAEPGLSMSATNDDDAFLASVTRAGHVNATWQLAGNGHEEIVSLTDVAGGFLAGVAYTGDLAVGAHRLRAPNHPATGAALVIRPAGGP